MTTNLKCLVFEGVSKEVILKTNSSIDLFHCFCVSGFARADGRVHLTARVLCQVHPPLHWVELDRTNRNNETSPLSL